MREQIEITSDCDALNNPHPDGERLEGVRKGSVLLLLRQDDRDYYKVALGGRPIFVPRSCGLWVESNEVREYSVPGWQPESPAEGEIGTGR